MIRFASKIALACAPFVLASALTAQIRIVGSDLAKPAFESLSKAPGAEGQVELDLSGSQPALAALRDGKADLAVLLITPNAKNDFTGLRRSPLGFQAIVYVVSDRNPLEAVTVNQLRGIFGADETSRVNRWGDLGLSGEWSNRNITVRSIAPRASLAYDFFRHTVLASPRTRPNLSLEDSTEQLFRAIRQDPSSVGISPVPPSADSGLKVLAVSGGTGETPFPPTLENLNLGDYKHRLSIELVYNPESRAKVKSVAAKLYTDAFAAELEKVGLLPIPPDIRRQIAEDWAR